MHHLFFQLFNTWPSVGQFARGGGGGSGGGGGGGGGGGSGGGSGGGGGIYGLVMLGYIPVHYVTQFCMQRLSQQTARVIAITVAVLVACGGLTIGSIIDGVGGFFGGLLVALGAGIGLYSGFHNWVGRVRDRITAGKKAAAFAARTDPAWNGQALQDRITNVFMQYQKDWTEFNIKNIQAYTSPRYFRHVQLMLTALYQMGRQNVVEKPEILDADVVDVIDQADNDQDTFSAYIRARANDQLIDMKTKQVLSIDRSMFEELWWFDRDGDQWMLERIDQATADAQMRDYALQKFAEENGMFYSLDWGWLLLPQRGQLFDQATFKESDINNHVIGQWNNNIVQLYTYIPKKSYGENYLIAQITLPKSYGGIIVRRNKGWRGWGSGAPSNYIRIATEWPDFNKQYTLYATDMDKVTSFELLNPKFMADLYDKDLGVSIEVVDNVIYLYAQTTGLTSSGAKARYSEMLDVLQAAYKELKL